MRIAVLTNEYPPLATGGAGRIAYVYNQLLERHGYEVRVWNCGLKFGRWRSKKQFWRFLNHLLDLLPSKKTAEEIISWKPDVLLSHNLTGCGFGTPRLVQFEGVRWVHFLHDVQLFEPSGKIIFGESLKFFRHLWRMIWSLLRRRALGRPDAVVSPTNWLLNEHAKHKFFMDTISEVIPNPLCVDAVMDVNLIRDPKQVLFVGRLDYDKGLGILLDAWALVKNSAGKLVILGNGEMRQDIEKLKDPLIEMRGSVTSQEVFKAMLQSGVVVVPSLVMENQPTVILEALVFSCRVVAAEVGGVKETLDSAGYLVNPGSVNALAQGLKAALTDPDDKERARNRGDVLDHHDPEGSVLRLIGLFKSNL
ncbi:MAG: glycosyltransferase family 4 protein [Patescibacteria group bacterium]